MPGGGRNTSWGGTRRSFPRATRELIMTRDNYRCQIKDDGCLGTATQADHIRPWSQGGGDDPENGQAVCAPCHNTKTKRERQQGQAKHSRKRTPMQHPGLKPQ